MVIGKGDIYYHGVRFSFIRGIDTLGKSVIYNFLDLLVRVGRQTYLVVNHL
jgi:hypothetical protein